jgi:hypothetical protein
MSDEKFGRVVATLSSDSIAEALDRQITSPSPVLSLCRQLVGAGVPSSLPMDVFREGSSEAVLRVTSIGEAARLEIGPRGFKSRKVKDRTTPKTD